MPNFMKILPVGAELFLADGRKDGQHMTKQIVAFRDFTKMPKNAYKDLLENIK